MHGDWSGRGSGQIEMSYDRFMKPIGIVLTFVSRHASRMVFFRSSTMEGATDSGEGMIGLNGERRHRSLVYRFARPLAAGYKVWEWLPSRGRPKPHR